MHGVYEDYLEAVGRVKDSNSVKIHECPKGPPTGCALYTVQVHHSCLGGYNGIYSAGIISGDPLISTITTAAIDNISRETYDKFRHIRFLICVGHSMCTYSYAGNIAQQEWLATDKMVGYYIFQLHHDGDKSYVGVPDGTANNKLKSA